MSTREAENPEGRLMAGTLTSSRQTVIPQELQIK